MDRQSWKIVGHCLIALAASVVVTALLAGGFYWCGAFVAACALANVATW